MLEEIKMKSNQEEQKPTIECSSNGPFIVNNLKKLENSKREKFCC